AMQLRWIRDGALSAGGAPPAVPRRQRSSWLAAVALGAAAAGAVVALGAARRAFTTPAAHGSLRQLTLRAGFVDPARVTPGGQTLVSSASWDGLPPRVFSLRVDSAESQPMPLGPASVLSVSRSGELALLTDVAAKGKGKLARVLLGGAGVREVASDVFAADWSPD